MKIFYYTRDNKIKELSIKYILLLFIPISIFFSVSYSVVQHFFFTSTVILQKENRRLKDNLTVLNEKINTIKFSLNDLYNKEKSLRVASNIKISNEGEFGIGGAEQSTLPGLFNIHDAKLNEMNNLSDNILNQINYQKNNFNLIEEKITKDKDLFSKVPSVMPMNGVMAEHGFGMRLHPIYHTWKMHEGLDILGNLGDPIIASGSGKVSFIGYRGGYGLCIELEHGYGYSTIYGHLSKTNVSEGQLISRFQKIGECGNTGLSVGPHLHYEVIYNGEKVDPMNYIFN